MSNAIFWIVALHFVISIFCFVYVAVEWQVDQDYIFANGWTIEDCTPVGAIEVPLYFIPIVNLILTYIALKLMEELMLQENEGQVINVYLGKFGFHYQEID